MGKGTKAKRDKKKDGRQGKIGGEKSSPNAQKQAVSTDDGDGGTSSQHKYDDSNSVQNNKGVYLEPEAGPSGSGSQVGTQMKHSGESECKELTADSSVSTCFEMSDICCCTECRVILKEMVETHPQKDDYIAKFEEHRIVHDVGCNETSKGPSGEQKSDIQASDVKSSPVGVAAEQLSHRDTEEEVEEEEDWNTEVATFAAEERSSGGEDCQAAGGGHDWGEKQPEARDAQANEGEQWDAQANEGEQWDAQANEGEQWDAQVNEGEQRGNEGRNEDNWSRDRSDDQKGRRDKDNWRTQDGSAGDRGGRGRGVKREGKGHEIVKEVFGDLFDAPKEWSLAHCVATDMRMGSGIAVSFRQNFKNVSPLLEQGARVGHIAVLEHEGRYIYYLVTKKYSTGKPFFEDLVSSLQKMRDHCVEHGVKHLAMPRIGCGLDRLEWRDVRPKIEEIFSGLDISITVYNFNQPETEEDGQHARKKRHLPVTHRMQRLVNIETQTALLYFGSEDGSVDECGKDLDRKFNFLLEYKKERKTVGDVVRLEKRNEVLYGLIVRKKERDAFSYINFEKCLIALRKLVKKDEFFYIGIEAFCVSNDDATMEKVITVMKNVLTAPELELFVCWPKELEHCYRDNVDVSDQREGWRK